MPGQGAFDHIGGNGRGRRDVTSDRAAGFVIVGASLAGVRAAEAAHRVGYKLPVTLIGDEIHLPYDRPPLSKAFIVDGGEADYHLSADELTALGVTMRLGVTATAIDSARKRVLLSNGKELPYDKLLICTGASPRRLLQLPALPGIFHLRTLDDAEAIRKALDEGSEVVIVGAGFIGSEIASSAKKHGANVTIVEASPVPLVRAVGPVIGDAISGLHKRNGVRLLCGIQIEQVIGEDRVRAVRLSNGETIPADLVVVGIGAAPATAWLAGSGIQLHPGDGGIICNEYLETSIPGIYAAGDLAHWPNGAMDMAMRLENWTNAADQGAHAAMNAVGRNQPRAYESVPYFWSDWYGQRIQFVGSAVSDSVTYASGGSNDDRFLALYRLGNRLIGATALNEPRQMMKLRRFIGQNGHWDDVAALLESAAVPR